MNLKYLFKNFMKEMKQLFEELNVIEITKNHHTIYKYYF